MSMAEGIIPATTVIPRGLSVAHMRDVILCLAASRLKEKQ